MEFNKKNFIERKIVVQTLKKWFCMEYKNLITTAVKINILSIWPPEKIVCFFRTPIKKLIVFYANFSREYWKFLKQSDFLSFKLIYRYYIWVNIKGGFFVDLWTEEEQCIKFSLTISSKTGSKPTLIFTLQLKITK